VRLNASNPDTSGSGGDLLSQEILGNSAIPYRQLLSYSPSQIGGGENSSTEGGR